MRPSGARSPQKPRTPHSTTEVRMGQDFGRRQLLLPVVTLIDTPQGRLARITAPLFFRQISIFFFAQWNPWVAKKSRLALGEKNLVLTGALGKEIKPIPDHAPIPCRPGMR